MIIKYEPYYGFKCKLQHTDPRLMTGGYHQDYDVLAYHIWSLTFIVQICWLQSWEYLFDFSPLGFHSVCICLTFLQCAFSHQLDLVLSTTSISSSRVSRLGLHTTSQYIGVSYIYCLLMFGLSKIQITIWLVNSTCPCGPHIQIIPRGYHIQVHIYLSFPHLQTEWRQKSMESSAIGSLPVFCLESETW